MSDEVKGYCPCCGAEVYTDGTVTHDETCVFLED